MNITPIFFQTSKVELPKYISEMIKSKIPKDWKYLHFTDHTILQFFEENPLEEFPNISSIFKNLKHGFHKADVFRYYFLYIKGGVFMDSDAMIYTNINEVIKDFSFFSVDSSYYPGTIFQGILGSNPKNPIIKEALQKCCETPPEIIANNFHLWCKQLYDIINNNSYDFKYKLYRESNTINGICDIVDSSNKILFKHYWKTKTVPNIEPSIEPNTIRLHIPYTNDEYTDSGRAKRFSRMMRSCGFEVYHYGIESSESDANKHIELMTKEIWNQLRIKTILSKHPTLSVEEALQHKDDPTTLFDEQSPLVKEFNIRFSTKLAENYRSNTTDIVCLPKSKTYDESVLNKNYAVIDLGIGYAGCKSGFRIFESHSWMAKILGSESMEPNNYWFVIPSYFDINEYKLSEKPNLKKVGFLDTLLSNKGCGIIVEIAKRFPQIEFILCGNGDPNPFLQTPNIVYKKPINSNERSEYLGECIALLCPSKLLEPYCDVSIEAQLCGTPVICSDWGSMTETIEQFKTGLRCHTLADYCYGIQMAIDNKFDRNYIRERAASLYDMYKIAYNYEYVFKSVLDVFTPGKNGWYSSDTYLVNILPKESLKGEVDKV